MPQAVPNLNSVTALFTSEHSSGDSTVTVDGTYLVDALSFDISAGYSTTLSNNTLVVGGGTASENIYVTGQGTASLNTFIDFGSSSSILNVQVQSGTLSLLKNGIFPTDGTVNLIVGSAGTFDVGAFSTTISYLTGEGAISIPSGGTLTIQDGDYSGSITSTSGGTLTIQGGDYSGSITSDGTLTIQGGDYSGFITSDGTLTIQGGDYSGSMSGGGDVVISDGTVTFSGIMQTTGSLTVDSGAALVSGSITSLSADSPVIVDGMLTISNSGNEIYSLNGSGFVTGTGGLLLIPHGGVFIGTIAGDVALALDGGTFSFSGIGSGHTGAVNVSGGICEISSGATLGSSSNISVDTVSPGATLGVNGTLYCGPLQNDGTVSISSTGEIFCTTLTSTGALTGCGTINVDGTVTNLSTVNPGCSTTPMTINGNFESLSGSILSPSLDGSALATLIVSGDATLGNDVALILRPESDCYEKSHNYAVLTAGGAFSGTFSEIEMGTHLLIPHLTYGTHGVELTVARTPIRNFATGDNAAEVAEALESLADSGYSVPCSAVKKLFFSSRSEIETALESMDPALFKGQTLSQENNVVKIRETLSYRMQDVLNREHCWDFSSEKPKEKPKNRSQKPKETPQTTCKKGERVVHLWIDGFGDYLFQNNITFAGTPQIGYQTNTGGGVVGLDYHFAKVCYVGALGAYTGSGTEWKDQFGKGTINTAYAGLYFSAIGEMFYGNISVIGGWSHFTGHRNILFPDETLTANNGHGGDQILSHVDTGINFGFKGFTIRPFDSLDYICGVEHSFTETGAGEFDLHLEKSNAIMLRNELGLQLSSCFCLGSSKWTFAPSLSWVREIRIKGSTYTASFVGTATSFEVTGYFPNRNLISPGVLLSGMLMDDFLSLDLYYNGEFATKYSDNSFGGQIRFGF